MVSGMKKPPLSEKDVKKQIRDCLYAVGARPVSIGASILGENGISDFLVCYKGQFVAIEVKKEGWAPPGRQAKAYKHYVKQWEFLQSIKMSGGRAFFASSVETVIDELGLNVELYPLFYEKGGQHGKV